MGQNIKNINQIFKELNYILNRAQKRKAVFVFLVIIISSLFELVGVSAVLPFIQAILSPEELMDNYYVGILMDFMGIETSNALLFVMGGMLILLYLFKNAYMIFSYYIQYSYSTRVQKDLSIKMLASYMKKPYEFFLDISSAEILRVCSADTVGVYNVIENLLSVFSESLTIIMISAFIVVTDPFIAIGVLLLMAIVLIGIVVYFKPTVKVIGQKNLELGTLRYKTISQAVMGIKEIFVMQRKKLFTEAYVKSAEEYRRIQKIYAVLKNSPERITEGICVSGIIGIVCIRILSSNTNALEFVPKLGAFAMAAFKVLPSIGKLANRITGIVYDRPALANVYKNIKDSDIYSLKEQEYIKENFKNENEENAYDIKFEDKILVDKIGWQYKNQKKKILSDLSLVLHKGETIALIGESGAGKTTLSDIILGLLHPEIGSITMDGIDIFAMPTRWGHIVGYVPQNVFLLDDTVRNNISFGVVENVEDKDIWKALEEAQLKQFVKDLPEGLDTVVGERGVKFSGGQRQRLAIARALFNKPEILVLDEATAALDNETENCVMEAIDSLKGSITMIIVAHRLSTIRNCDKIYEIIGGKAIERDKNEVLNRIY